MKGNVRTSIRAKPGIESAGIDGSGKVGGGDRNKDGDSTTRTLHTLVAAVNNANMATVYVTARSASPLEDLVALHPQNIVALVMKDIPVLSDTVADSDDSPCGDANTRANSSTSSSGGIDHTLVAALLRAGIDKVYVTAQTPRQLLDLIATYPGTLVAVGLDIANDDDPSSIIENPDVTIIVNAAAYEENSSSTPKDQESAIQVDGSAARSLLGQRFLSLLSRCIGPLRASSRSPRKPQCDEQRDDSMLAIGCYPGSIVIEEGTPSNEVAFAHLDAFLDCETTSSNSDEEDEETLLSSSSAVVAKAIF